LRTEISGTVIPLGVKLVAKRNQYSERLRFA
jgi:hypothetical protein